MVEKGMDAYSSHETFPESRLMIVMIVDGGSGASKGIQVRRMILGQN